MKTSDTRKRYMLLRGGESVSNSMPEKIALDNNVHNFLVEALYDGYNPVGDTVDQERLATLRCFFYLGNLYIPPTVSAEYIATKNEEKRARLQSTEYNLLNEINDIDEDEVNKGLLLAKKYHHSEKDCRIFAEALASQMNVLLTFDSDMLRLNNANAAIRVETPTHYFFSKNIHKGATPLCMPHSSNPLFHNRSWEL